MTTPHMTLPDGSTIKSGGYGRTRSGEKVGPMEFSNRQGRTAPWDCGWRSYHTDGRRWTYANQPETDIIAAWVEQPAALDLSNPNGTVFGLMDAVYGPGTKAAMQAWPHGVELYGSYGWVFCDQPYWLPSVTYRAKPAPKRVTLILMLDPDGSGYDAYPIGTIDMVDGKPDPASVKMDVAP